MKRFLLKGMTLIELLLTITIISIFFASAIVALLQIQKAIQVNKYVSLATNVAQEKIESMKNISYYRLLVTTTVSLGYDAGYYPPETLVIGDINFSRKVLVERVRETSTGTFEVVAYNAGETDIKRIKVMVSWNDPRRGEQTFSLYNVRENPNRPKLNGTVTGHVSSSLGTPIDNARIYIEENSIWDAYSNASGNYSLKCGTGTFTLRCTKSGYWDKTESASVTPTATKNFTLTRILTVNATGFVWIRNHLVISQVCADTNWGGGREFVELYNPTTWQWNMSSSTLRFMYVDSDDNVSQRTVTFISSYTLPNRFFLLLGSTNGSTSTPTGLNADATYYATISNTDPAGVAILDGDRVWIDSVSWGNVGAGRPPPLNARETEGYTIAGGNLDDGDVLVRRLFYNYNDSENFSPIWGNCLDQNDNSKDFDDTTLSNSNVRNSTTTRIPYAGQPAEGAVISCDDGLSNTTTADSTGYFSLTGIATGYWTLAVTSNTLYGETSGYFTTNVSTIVVLSTTTTYGLVSGKVKLAGGWYLNDILVKADGSSKRTNLSGQFLIPVSIAGSSTTVYVTANAGYNNSNYTEKSTGPVTIYLGQITDVGTLELQQGAYLYGRVRTASGAVPDIVVTANATTGGYSGQGISDSNGYYEIKNLPLATYNIYPVLDASETSSPASVQKILSVAGIGVEVATFTISNAMGKITGTVKYSNELIKTGVLIIATTGTISGDPPDINMASPPSICYYMTSSKSDGTYEVEARAGTHNLYAWYYYYGTYSKKSYSSVTVTAGGRVTKDFNWP